MYNDVPILCTSNFYTLPVFQQGFFSIQFYCKTEAKTDCEPIVHNVQE